MSHMCKRIFRFELQLSSYWQNIKFSRNCPKFQIFTRIVIFQEYLHFLDHLLHPYKFHGSDMSGILFFMFVSCKPLIHMLYVTCSLMKFMIGLHSAKLRCNWWRWMYCEMKRDFYFGGKKNKKKKKKQTWKQSHYLKLTYEDVTAI